MIIVKILNKIKLFCKNNHYYQKDKRNVTNKVKVNNCYGLMGNAFKI